MRFLVVGAGAIGGFLAGRLLAAGHAVTVFARGAHLQAMQIHGLRLENAQGQLDYLGPVDTCTDLRNAPVAEVVIVTLKAHQTLRHPAIRALALELMRETSAVATALGCPVSASFEERLDRATELITARPSMLQDLETNRPMELDAILGAVVELGQLVGVATHRIEALLACLRVIDQPAHEGAP